MSPDLQSALQSYARGVNEVISLANATGHFPPEYTALSITHIPPWVPVDSVVFGKLQAFQLSFDFDDGLTNDLASVTGVLGPATGETAFYQDLARSEPAENAFTVPDANGTPIPLAAVAAPQRTMLARAATKGSAATLQSPAHGGQQAHAAARRAAVAARKEAVQKSREFIAKLMGQPAMRAIRERGVLGSNEWVVDGSVTDTGNPILANDPHLSLGSPPTFYELHINTKDRGGDTNVTGIGFAGAPGVVQGHNEHIAWGSTTNPTDVTDWYLEDISSDANGNLFSHYLGNPEPITELPLQVKVNVENGNETPGERQVLAFATGIPVADVKGVVDVTGLLAQFVPPKVLVVGRHGPIFPQTLSPFPFPPNHTGGSAISTQFTGLFPTRELETFFIWDKATNLAEFKTGLQFFDFGSQNWSYADTAGNIAYFASGEFPIREDIAGGTVSGNPPWVFRNGTGGNEWKPLAGPQRADQAVPFEIVPTADIPHIENPPAHFFVSANNDPIGNTADNDPLNEALAGTAPYLTRDYDGDFRAARITELIKSELNLIPTPPGTPAGDGTISFADMQRMQADVNQLDGRRLAGYFVTAVTNAQAGGAPPALSSLVSSRILDAKARLAAWTYNTPAGFDTAGDPGVPTAQDLVDSVATTIYNVALGRLVVNTFDATLAANGISFRQGTLSALRGLLRLLDAVPFTGVGASGINFFDDPSVSLSAANERDIILVKSLQQALDLLGSSGFTDAYALSQNVDDYLWGKVHYVIFKSFLDGALNATHVPGGGAFSLPPQPAPFPPGYPTDGGRFTVDVANFGLRPTTESDLAFGSGPNRRSVVEMGPTGPVRAKNVIPGGEDGVVGHPHYGDQINDWLADQTHDTLLATADVVNDAQSRTNFPTLRCTDTGVGRCIPGKGNRTTECTSEFFVNAPVDALAIRMATLTIADGSAADFDGAANGSCVVQLMVCINNNDPRLTDAGGAQCQSPDVATYQLKRPLPDVGRAEDKVNAAAILATLSSLGSSSADGSHTSTLTFTPAVTAQDSCVDTYVVIPIHNGHPTRKFFKSIVTQTNGGRDADSLRIICTP